MPIFGGAPKYVSEIGRVFAASHPNLSEICHIQTAAFNDTFERAEGNGFAAMHSYNHLAAIFMPPFLVAAGLCNQNKTVVSQNFDDFLGIANWKPLAHGKASSTSLAPLFSLTGEGSNQRDSASFALATASASVSPADAQPGSSGKTADQRLVSASNSTNKRNFMGAI